MGVKAALSHPCQCKALLLLAVLSLGLLAITSSATGASIRQAKQQIDDKQIRDLVRQLGDDQFEKREEAGKKLIAVGEPALVTLQLAARVSEDPEIRQRARQLVVAINSKLFFVVRSIKANQALGAWVTRVLVTPDGKKVIGAGTGPPAIWDLDSGQQLEPFAGGKTAISHALAISADGNGILVGTDGKAAHAFDLKAGKMSHILAGHKGEVRGAVLLAGGKTALTASYDKSIRVWSVETGKELRQLDGVTDKVSCLAVSPDGRTVAGGIFFTAGSAGTIHLWDLDTGASLRSLKGHTKEVTSVAFSPDGTRLLSGSADGSARLWDVAAGKELMVFEGPIGRVENAAFTPDGKRVVTCGGDQASCLRLWDVDTGRQILQSEELGSAITGLAVLPDSRHCVTSGKDGTIRLWEWSK
jgi:WD40 repeat protein